MTTCAARQRAEMVITASGDSATLTVLAWQPPAAAARPGQTWPAAGWHHVAALAGRCPAAQLEIADLIISPQRLRNSEAAAWLRAMLDRYPGCAVAAAGTGSLECLVGTRGGPPVSFVLGACADACEPGCLAWLCGSLVHAWLSGGGLLAELGPAQVRVTVSGTPAGWCPAVQGGAVLCSLRVAGKSACGPRASRRCRICPSSGAPTSA